MNPYTGPRNRPFTRKIRVCGINGKNQHANDADSLPRCHHFSGTPQVAGRTSAAAQTRCRHALSVIPNRAGVPFGPGCGRFAISCNFFSHWMQTALVFASQNLLNVQNTTNLGSTHGKSISACQSRKYGVNGRYARDPSRLAQQMGPRRPASAAA